MTDRERLLDRAADLTWFHTFDFGDCQTRNRHPKTPDNNTLFGVMDTLRHVDLTGLDCIDIGAADGLVAFNMASRGARRVVATDFSKKGRETSHVAKELLDLDVEIMGDTTFDNLIDKVGEHSFDVVVCAGVLYHMLNPFDCILKSRRLLKRDGLLFLMTRHHPEDPLPTLDFNPTSGRVDIMGTFFVPSRSALLGMLALGGFQLLAIRTGTKHKFITTVCSNVPVEEITDAPELILQQHAHGNPYPEFKSILPDDSTAAYYNGPQDDQIIDDKTYKPDFYPHPTESKRIIGPVYKSPFSTQ